MEYQRLCSVLSMYSTKAQENLFTSLAQWLVTGPILIAKTNFSFKFYNLTDTNPLIVRFLVHTLYMPDCVLEKEYALYIPGREDVHTYYICSMFKPSRKILKGCYSQAILFHLPKNFAAGGSLWLPAPQPTNGKEILQTCPFLACTTDFVLSYQEFCLCTDISLYM